MKPKSELILYQTEDNRTRIEVRLENETVWLTQAQMAELFQTTPQNITLHLRAIFAEGELVETATCKDYLQVQTEGKRQVARQLHYEGQLVANCYQLKNVGLAITQPAPNCCQLYPPTMPGNLIPPS
jgi:hypothetical protein